MGYVPFFAFVFVSWPSLEEDWPFEGSACDDRIAGVAGKQAAARNAGIWMDALAMKITLAAIVPRRSRTKSEATDRLLADYVERAARYLPCDSQVFDAEAALLEWLERQPGRAPAYAILLDSRGQQYSSEEFAGHLETLRDAGTQRLVLAVGPADGWSAAARLRANRVLSLGRMTLPHQLARVILAEQVYRAITILAGHPYHRA